MARKAPKVGPALRAGPSSRPVSPQETPARLASQAETQADPGQPAPPPAAHAYPLFAYAQPDNAAALDAALPAPARTIHYVRINSVALAGKRSPFWQPRGAPTATLAITTPEGETLAVVIDRSEMLGPDRFTSVGHIAGRPESRALFSYNRGFLHASIEDTARGTFALRAATAELSQFYRVDPELVAPCGGERRPDFAALQQSGTGVPPAIMGETPMPLQNPQHAEVHVLMLYTQAVLPTLAGQPRRDALLSAFDNAIAKTNLALAASQVTARLKLVGIAETQLAGDDGTDFTPGWQDTALTSLYKTADGGMDEIHALRDRTGADFVCLALNRRDSTSSGLSFLLDTANDPRNAQFAFSVVEYGRVAGTNVVPHEFGHVFGCAHAHGDPGATGLKDGAFTYSYGYRVRGADGQLYHDIMGYAPGAEVSFYSNPRIVLPTPINVAIGDATEADAARTIEETAFASSAYRLQTQTPANRGTLINVASRAFVGGGDRVLIAGFVIDGSEAKRVLLRGAGPALAGFGVSNALVDPVLRVFSLSGAKLAENDDWNSAATPTTPGTAALATPPDFAGAGAFPFLSGSRDAALVTTLAPGAYTAVVESRDGSEGSALVEAYEVAGSGSRIVNLSTRGFADNVGHELIGSFVVQPSAGTSDAPKRILVRVLGPTLERDFGITGALHDPVLELHGASGALLVDNDDWSADAARPDGTRDDFQPLVRAYGEQQIAATGFAPKNRRESAVLVDLPPGNYTVVVKPFERRDSDPDLNEPAQPGVAIVEVYEIR